MDLFDHAREQTLEQGAPLAARMRPRTLDEFAGQRHVLGPGRLLRRAIQADQLSSLIFFGPPGTGKTTLARIIANTTQAHFSAINAVLAGVADIRRVVGEAEARLGQHGRRTILFVDEVHRFNKAQQDALLPHVESGTLILIGATTENPYFEVNKALVSRSRLFELKSLEEEDLRQLMQRALDDGERGYGQRNARLDDDAAEHLARVANGDARAALNALELAVETTDPDAEGVVRITLEVAEDSIQRKAVLYDKDGDAHFDAVSAFIKSLRGSDADAALYWMARMLYAGEEPRFILRRMVIFAAEDIGLADPNALRVAMSATQAFDYVGLPEGRFHLSEACLYLATAPKSNSTFAFFDALKAVEQEQTGDVPDPLKDASRDAEGLGHGQGYLYPHAYRDHWVAQQYLPDSLQGRVFYQPGALGFEEALRDRVLRMREAALAALVEAPEVDTTSADADGTPHGEGRGRTSQEWVRRGQGNVAPYLARVAERMFGLAQVQRSHLVLDANAAGGLLTGEALRRAREGGVWARVDTAAQSAALLDQARLAGGAGEALSLPVVLTCALEDLPAAIAGHEGANDGAGGHGVRFDRLLARSVLGRGAQQPAAPASGTPARGTQGPGGPPAAAPDKQARVALLAALLAPAGQLVLAEPVPSRAERPLACLDWSGLSAELVQRTLAAEEAAYADASDDLVNWSEEHLTAWLQAAGLTVRHRELWRPMTPLALPPGALERWFGTGAGAGGRTPGRLAAALGDDAAPVRAYLERVLRGSAPPRRMAVALVVAERE